MIFLDENRRFALAKAMYFKPYSESEIDGFVRQKLIFADDFSRAVRKRLREEFAHATFRLPPWQQALMMECQSANVVGTCETINHLWGDAREVVGFFTPEDVVLKTNGKEKFIGSNGIFWAMDDRRPQAEVIYHEHGHRIDHLLAVRFLQNAQMTYYTSSSHVWYHSLDMQTEEVNNESEVRLRHDRQRALTRYLEDYDDKEERVHESFAEINTYYCQSHRAIDSDDELIRMGAEHDFPFLLPVYQHEIRPKAEQLAFELRAKRTGAAPVAQI